MSEEEHNAWIRSILPEAKPGEELDAYEKATRPDRPFVSNPERNQEPVKVAPIPPTERVRDPERVTVPPASDNVTTSKPHSPTRTRTQPFLPARRAPEYLPTPVQPTIPLQPRFTTTLYGKQNKAGRQRGKDRTDSTDGVRQLFELWWSKPAGERHSNVFIKTI